VGDVVLDKVARFYDYHWSCQGGVMEQEVMEELPNSLRNSVSSHINGTMIDSLSMLVPLCLLSTDDFFGESCLIGSTLSGATVKACKNYMHKHHLSYDLHERVDDFTRYLWMAHSGSINEDAFILRPPYPIHCKLMLLPKLGHKTAGAQSFL